MQGAGSFLLPFCGGVLNELQHYQGGVALILINFPSPCQKNSGNFQLPSKQSGQYMVMEKVLQLIGHLLLRSDQNAFFLFQPKCEDVAVHVKNECLALSRLECVPCKNPVENIDCRYTQIGKRPKRVDQWLKAKPSPERAEGQMYSCTRLLPMVGQPETEAQCDHDNTVVHGCLFQLKSSCF